MTTKVSADMYPLNELRKEFASRIRTTAFVSQPEAFVSFKLFSLLTPMMADSDVSKLYVNIIEKALSNLSFYTNEGVHKLSSVQYMFTDDNKNIVAVMTNGTPLDVLYYPNSKNSHESIKAESPLECRVSVSQLKDYYLNHISDFPYLDKLTDLLNTLRLGEYSKYSQIRSLADKCSEDSWVNENIYECLEDLDHLLDHASFVLDYKKSKKDK